MKRVLLFFTLLLGTMFAEAQCDAPTGLGYNCEENVPGYSYHWRVTMYWDAVDGAEYYDVYVNGQWFGYSIGGTTYIAGSNNTGSFVFTVKTICSDGESEMSEPCTVIVGPTVTVCDTPTGLGYICEEDVPGFEHKWKVTLSWDAVEGAEYYNVYVNGEFFGMATEGNYIVAGYDTEGTYYFTVQTVCSDGQSDFSEPYTFVIATDAVPEYGTSFEIYPNPVRDNLIINTEETIESVAIYNMIGVLVKEQCYDNNNIDVADIAKGVYVIRIKTDKGDVVKHFVKD
ncbi:MAG: T9SS type A sorting domain-containing protein [Candidatus Limimorpha sp.]